MPNTYKPSQCLSSNVRKQTPQILAHTGSARFALLSGVSALHPEGVLMSKQSHSILLMPKHSIRRIHISETPIVQTTDACLADGDAALNWLTAESAGRLHDDGDDDGGSPYNGHHPGFHSADGSTPGPEVMPDGSLRYLSQPPILKAGQVPQVQPRTNPCLILHFQGLQFSRLLAVAVSAFSCSLADSSQNAALEWP